LAYEWVVGGVWLQELITAKTPEINGTIQNLRLLTFDEKSGEYIGTVLDNLNSRTYPVRMKWLDDKTLESVIEVEGIGQKWRIFKIINIFTKISDYEIRAVQQQKLDDSPPTQTGSRIMKKIRAK
jgi:hypothetical protein